MGQTPPPPGEPKRPGDKDGVSGSGRSSPGKRGSPARRQLGPGSPLGPEGPADLVYSRHLLPPSSSDSNGQQYSEGTSEGSIRRRVLIEERRDDSRRIPQGTRQREEIEYVAVPRRVQVQEEVSGVPVTRVYQDIQPQWETQTIVRQIPKEKIEYQDHVVPIAHKRVIDEYVEKPYDAGEEVKCVPRVEVQEREVEVKIPRVVWETREEEVPEVREIVRYIEADHNTERVVRYICDSPDAKSPQNIGESESVSSSEESLESPMQGVIMPKKARYRKGTHEPGVPTTIDIPVPFLVPKPVCVEVEVPLVKFNDNFVPVPVRRHVTPKITFTNEIFEVPVTREQPVLVVSDAVKPVPVDCHIRIREKDLQIRPVDPAEISQADMQAMWMRTNADLLDNFRSQNEGLAPRGLHVPEDQQVPLQEDDLEAILAKEEADNEARRAEAGEGDGDDTDKTDLGPVPLHPGHPLMMTWLQAQWMQSPSNQTHAMYNDDFLRKHQMALNLTLDPHCHAVNLTEAQMEELGDPNVNLPNPWSMCNLMKDHAFDMAEARHQIDQEIAEHTGADSN